MYEKQKVNCEIDFLAVGNGERSGDAICLRWGNLSGHRSEQTVVVIDGGFEESGKRLADRIKSYYNTKKIDLMISTHPDLDHSSGLRTVLNEMETVQLIWMHLPWKHANGMAYKTKDGRITDHSLKERLKDSLQIISEIEETANKRKISITEPFENLPSGTTFESNGGKLFVLSPSKERYNNLLFSFRDMPDEKKENLEESSKTSAENESSVVLLLQIQDKYFLFTGDAGVESLNNSCDILRGSRLKILENFTLIQAPHHGSKRNLSDELLDRLVGKKALRGWLSKTAVIISASKNNPKHPSPLIIDGFADRGVNCFSTRGSDIYFRSPNLKIRKGWAPVESEKNRLQRERNTLNT